MGFSLFLTRRRLKVSKLDAGNATRDELRLHRRSHLKRLIKAELTLSQLSDAPREFVIIKNVGTKHIKLHSSKDQATTWYLPCSPKERGHIIVTTQGTFDITRVRRRAFKRLKFHELRACAHSAETIARLALAQETREKQARKVATGW